MVDGIVSEATFEALCKEMNNIVIYESRRNKELLISVFTAIEQRNDQRFAELLHPDFEIHWPPSLPYGSGKGRTWSDIWHPLQPSADERKGSTYRRFE